jgi:hypothetical protein
MNQDNFLRAFRHLPVTDELEKIHEQALKVLRTKLPRDDFGKACFDQETTTHNPPEGSTINDTTDTSFGNRGDNCAHWRSGGTVLGEARHAR